ncbi:hypothetical protein BH23ACT10_BH23ACT10_17040 [soil metagenome]
MATTTTARWAAPSVRQVVTLAGYVLVVTVNALANALPINGITSGAVSDRFPTFVTPAGYVFAIWGVIYALTGVFAVYQVRPAVRDDPGLQRLGYAFALSCVFNAAWIFAWHNLQIVVALGLIVALLVTLVVCYERLRGQAQDRADPHRSSWTWWAAVRLPFSIYLGWVTVATVANTAVTLVDAGIDGGAAAPMWGAVALVAATAVGVAMVVRRNDVAFALVVVWALIGIAVAQGGRSSLIVVVAAAACLALGAAIVVTWRHHHTATAA